MKEMLEFILSSFWIFIGTIILIAVVGDVIFKGIVYVIRALKDNKNEKD